MTNHIYVNSMPKFKGLSQQKRLINLMRERGKSGVFVYEIITPRPNGLGIAVYTSTICNLRKQGYQIDNPENGLYVLVGEPQPKQEKLGFL